MILFLLVSLVQLPECLCAMFSHPHAFIVPHLSTHSVICLFLAAFFSFIFLRQEARSRFWISYFQGQFLLKQRLSKRDFNYVFGFITLAS